MNGQYFTLSHLMSPYEHLVFHNSKITRALPAHLNGHRTVNLWFAGPSVSGKFTLAHAVEERLHAMESRAFVFDRDSVRRDFFGGLDGSLEDWTENIAGSLQ